MSPSPSLEPHPASSSSSSSSLEMKIDPSRASHLLSQLAITKSRIRAANPSNRPVRLVAVSKLKPPSDILSLYQAPPPSSTTSTSTSTTSPPQIHFGENYLQELQSKSALLPHSIRWHFIGALQTNKCRPLAETVPGLWCVESVDTAKKADGLEKGRANLKKNGEKAKEKGDEEEEEGGEKKEEEEGKVELGPLRVCVQVNTSGEESKSGTAPGADTFALCKHILTTCPHLRLHGLMTIGAIARSQQKQQHPSSNPEEEEQGNEDFSTLKRVRDEVLRDLRGEGFLLEGDGEGQGLELSMGMSEDFETAVRQGSDEVRVGSGIFGERPKKGDEVVKGDVAGGGG